MSADDFALTLQEVAVRVATGAGRLIHDERPADVEVAATKTSPVDVVTKMDLASEELIRAELARLRPEDGLLGEEGGLRSGTSGLTWVVDPIDGTVNYLYGVAGYAVSIAVVAGQPTPQAWQVLAGCVMDPKHDLVYSAARGHGAQVTDGGVTRPLQGPADVPLARALVGTGFGYLPGRRAAQARVLSGLLPRIRDIRRLGSAALDLCALADGLLDAYYERGLQPWDQAAGVLIAQEAGAVVTGLHGLGASEELVVGAAPGLHRALTELLGRLGASSDDR